VPAGENKGSPLRDVLPHPFDALGNDPDRLRVQAAGVVADGGEKIPGDEKLDVLDDPHGPILLAPNPVSFKKKERSGAL